MIRLVIFSRCRRLEDFAERTLLNLPFILRVSVLANGGGGGGAGAHRCVLGTFKVTFQNTPDTGV